MVVYFFVLILVVGSILVELCDVVLKYEVVVGEEVLEEFFVVDVVVIGVLMYNFIIFS